MEVELDAAARECINSYQNQLNCTSIIANDEKILQTVKNSFHPAIRLNPPVLNWNEAIL